MTDRYFTKASASNISQLFRAVSLLARTLSPIAIISALMLGALHLLYLSDPAKTRLMQASGVEHFIVLEQLSRSKAIKADIGFLGDSSCLMGIDPFLLDRRLGSVESYCTLGFVGPAGYAAMLDRMIEHHTQPEALVLAFHPAVFARNAEWDGWVNFVQNPDGNWPDLWFPFSGLSYLRTEWLSLGLFSPLPGAYGRFYGGEANFRRQIHYGKGGAIDPAILLRGEKNVGIEGVPFNPTPNSLFLTALDRLAESIRQFGPERTFLLITPVPESYDTAGYEARMHYTARSIAQRIGIGLGNIIEMPVSYPNALFSTVTHLNRMGRPQFTRDLSAALTHLQHMD